MTKRTAQQCKRAQKIYQKNEHEFGEKEKIKQSIPSKKISGRVHGNGMSKTTWSSSTKDIKYREIYGIPELFICPSEFIYLCCCMSTRRSRLRTESLRCAIKLGSRVAKIFILSQRRRISRHWLSKSMKNRRGACARCTPSVKVKILPPQRKRWTILRGLTQLKRLQALLVFHLKIFFDARFEKFIFQRF